MNHFSSLCVLCVVVIPSSKNESNECEPLELDIQKRVVTNINCTLEEILENSLQMAMQHYFRTWKSTSASHVSMSQPSQDKKDTLQNTSYRLDKPPSEQFMPLASVFRRRLLTGIGSASVVAVGANFAGVTSFLLGNFPDNSRSLKLDVLYPIGGYSRCIQREEGFEFIYPSNWVGDQTLLYRAAGKAESQRLLDPPPLSGRRRNINEPVVAFGPPGSTGELNVSLIVSPVAPDFSKLIIEAFGEADEVGEAVVRTITKSARHPNVKGSLIQASLREDKMSKNVKYYELEYKVESPTFKRHNIAVCCAYKGKLFTLNAQAPESAWPKLKSNFYKISNSFGLIDT